MGYGGLHMPTSACVHFVRNDEIDDSIYDSVAELNRLGIQCAYLNYSHGMGARDITNNIAGSLHLDHHPYQSGPIRPWLPWLDDLIALSRRVNGLVLIIDSADVFFNESRNDAFDLIEVFLIQFSDWFEKKKPCHLCFQIEPNDLVKKAFSS